MASRIPGNDRNAFITPPYEELERNESRSLETRFVNRAGVEKQVALTCSALNAGEAADGARVLVVADTTERVRLERELEDKERLASLGLLAAGVAHEVNTPLTGISSYAQLLLADTSPDDPRYKLLKKMEQQTFRASNLVNSLLDLIASRPRTREAVGVEELLRSTVALHEDLLRAKGVQVHLDVERHLEVAGNFHDLQQVVTNIVLNARDAVASGGNVWITAQGEGDRAVIRIRDDGKGIPESILGRLFEPLVTTKRGQGGTGLGLAIAKRIVAASDGDIRVESEPGAGATFVVDLPRLGGTLMSKEERNELHANPDR